jgi:glycosyltransferase involved in cell wall biosynthesis
MKPLNVHIYPSKMLHESRIERISGSLQSTGGFGATHLVGISADGLVTSEEISPGVVIRRFGSARSSGETTADKVRRLLSWFFSVYRTYRFESIAVVHAHSVWMLPLSWALAKRTSAVLSYLPHELETESARMRGPQQWAARRIEQWSLPRCQVFCVVNVSIADWYADHFGRRPIPVRNIPLDAGGVVNLRTRLGIPQHELLFVHTGHLMAGRSIPQILDTFAQVEDRHVLFIGDGALGPQVRSASARLRNVHWLPPVPSNEVASYVRGADVALVLIEPSCLSFRLSSPNKLFEALASGVPPLCTDLTEARHLLGSLSERWVLGPEERFEERVMKVSLDDVADFKQQWVPLSTWEHEVEPLVTAVVSSTTDGWLS